MTSNERAHSNICQNAGEATWLNITTGLKSVLMVSGLLLQAVQKDPSFRVNLVRRGHLRELMGSHPAVASVGYPPPDARVIAADRPGASGTRTALESLARELGISLPLEFAPFLPELNADIDFVDPFIPWGRQPVVAVAAHSDSPRKLIPPGTLQRAVERLTASGIFVVQLGFASEPHLCHAYSLLGQLSIAQQIAFLARCSALLSADNYFVPAARLVDLPAVVLWSANAADGWDSPGQLNLKALTEYCPEAEACRAALGSDAGKEPCPLEEGHCMNTIPVDHIEFSIRNVLRRPVSPEAA